MGQGVEVGDPYKVGSWIGWLCTFGAIQNQIALFPHCGMLLKDSSEKKSSQKAGFSKELGYPLYVNRKVA